MKTKKIILSILTLFIFIVYKNSYGQWIKSDKGMEGKQIKSLAYNNKYIFAGSINTKSGVFRSSDNGKVWTPSLFSVNRIIQLVVHDSIVIAAADNDGIYVSKNNGDNWDAKLTNNQIYAVAYNNDKFYSGTIGKKFYKSSDCGSKWDIVSNTLFQFRSLIAYDSIILAGTTEGVYFTSNGGINWHPTDLTAGLIISFSRFGNEIFAGTHNNGIYKSINNGINWIQFSTIDIDNYLLTLDNFVLSGTYKGGIVVYSCNKLQRRNEGLNKETVYAIIKVDNDILIGTGSSVFRRTICMNPFTN